MTKIRLKEIQLRNFKKAKSFNLKFDGDYSTISGANGSGKTTVYKAYYWCLTGKTLEPNEVIQTLDAENNIIHKVETSVLATLLVDDSYEVRIERKLVEDWKALGMPNEQLKGTKQLRYFNDIPLSVAEFNAKLNSICNLDKWLLLSNISTFMSMKMEERRKLLIEAAGNIDEDKLMAPYPDIMKAVNVEKKTVDELMKQTLSTKKRANDELRTIPSQIDAQDRLRIEEDFSALEAQEKRIDSYIHDIDKQLEGNADELEEAKRQREERTRLSEKIISFAHKWRGEHTKKIIRLMSEVDEARKRIREMEDELARTDLEQSRRSDKIAALQQQFESKKQRWIALSNESFSDEAQDVCPACGHRFTEEEKMERSKHAEAEYNRQKSEQLIECQREAEMLKEQITVLRGENNEYMQVLRKQGELRLNSLKIALNGVLEEIDNLQKQSVEEEPEYIELKNKFEQHPTPVEKKESIEALHAEKQRLNDEKKKILIRLAHRDTNTKIEAEKKRLDELSLTLAQTIADCDRVLYQVKEYRKAKMDAIENKVNSLFCIATWKFFEKNTSNDDYAEICMCTHNGVDYNSTNTADKVNLGCDIIYGLSKAFNIQSVLFVDNKEAVAEIIRSKDVQLITLEHIANAPIKLNNNI